MTSKDKEVSRVLEELQENLSVLQIKVGALEVILLKSDATRAEYTRLVNEQAEVLIRERQNKNENLPS